MELGGMPKDWLATTLGEVAAWSSGGTPSRSRPEYFRGNIPWIKTGELGAKYIRGAEERISETAIAQSSAKVFPKGAVGIAMYGATIGKLSIWGIDAATNQACAVGVCSEALNNEFLYYFLASEKGNLIKAGKGGAQPNISQGIIKEWPLNLPPLPEQHRIVAKIEELFSELDQGVASLKTAREQLKVYRQSLLKNAFEGKLTAAWRAAHPDQLETAAALQQRITRERHARYEQQLAEWEKSKSPSIPLLQRGKATQDAAAPLSIPPFEKGGPGGISKPKAPKPLPPLTAEELTELPELPGGWGWVSLASVVSVLSGYAFKSADFEAQGVPVVKIANVGYSQFIIKDQEYLAPSFLDTHGSFSVRAGDFLIALTRPITNNQTKVCRYPANGKHALLNQRVAALKEVEVNEEYFFSFLNTSIFKEFIRSKFSETLQPNLSPKDLEIAPFPVCSLAEQLKIVQELESKLSEADQLDQTLATALQQADALRQSILKKAFCGQLVEQDANDEPAAVLLERIRAERVRAGNQKSGRSR